MKKILVSLLMLAVGTISYAQSVDYLAGFSHNSKIIITSLTNRENEINKVYDFSMLEKNYILPPLVSILDKNEITTAYKIMTPARSYCVNNDLNNCIPLKASDYLYKGLIVSEIDEKIVDVSSKDYIKGENDAENITLNNLAFLHKEYMAMLLYKELTNSTFYHKE